MSERNWSVYIEGRHIKDCTDFQLRECLRYYGMEYNCVDVLTHSIYWPNGWAIWPLALEGYAAVDNGGQGMFYADGDDVIAGDTIFALVARVVIVSIAHKLTMGTGA